MGVQLESMGYRMEYQFVVCHIKA